MKKLTFISFLPVVKQSPKWSTESIENVGNDGDVGKVVVVVDEGETKGFRVEGEYTIRQGYTQDTEP